MSSAPSKPLSSNSGWLRLRVDGKEFSTRISTLCSEEGSRLEEMVRSSAGCTQDTFGVVYVEYDAELFAIIMHYLRTKRLLLRGHDVEDVLSEALWWRLPGLVTLCRDFMSNRSIAQRTAPATLAVASSTESVEPLILSSATSHQTDSSTLSQTQKKTVSEVVPQQPTVHDQQSSPLLFHDEDRQQQQGVMQQQGVVNEPHAVSVQPPHQSAILEQRLQKPLVSEGVQHQQPMSGAERQHQPPKVNEEPQMMNRPDSLEQIQQSSPENRPPTVRQQSTVNECVPQNILTGPPNAVIAAPTDAPPVADASGGVRFRQSVALRRAQPNKPGTVPNIDAASPRSETTMIPRNGTSALEQQPKEENPSANEPAVSQQPWSVFRTTLRGRPIKFVRGSYVANRVPPPMQPLVPQPAADNDDDEW